MGAPGLRLYRRTPATACFIVGLYVIPDCQIKGLLCHRGQNSCGTGTADEDLQIWSAWEYDPVHSSTFFFLIMKSLIVVCAMALLVVACGGSSADPKAAGTKNETSTNKPAFEAPPSPGGKT
jgi:hypothetical protein